MPDGMPFAPMMTYQKYLTMQVRLDYYYLLRWCMLRALCVEEYSEIVVSFLFDGI